MQNLKHRVKKGRNYKRQGDEMRINILFFRKKSLGENHVKNIFKKYTCNLSSSQTYICTILSLKKIFKVLHLNSRLKQKKENHMIITADADKSLQ